VQLETKEYTLSDFYSGNTLAEGLFHSLDANAPQLLQAVLTSGPFGDSMSSAARPKRWGVFRQAKGREFDPSRFELFTLLT
jgi:hypothetical protein